MTKEEATRRALALMFKSERLGISYEQALKAVSMFYLYLREKDTK